jgi:hypothetical protein
VAIRLAVVALVVVAVALAAWRYRAWKAGLTETVPASALPPLPEDWRQGERTWVVFTTPYCAACGPLADRLRQADPDARVVTVDATRQVELADAYRVRSAPTTVLAGPAGVVLGRFVGADAVTRYLAGATA